MMDEMRLRLHQDGQTQAGVEGHPAECVKLMLPYLDAYPDATLQIHENKRWRKLTQSDWVGLLAWMRVRAIDNEVKALSAQLNELKNELAQVSKTPKGTSRAV